MKIGFGVIFLVFTLAGVIYELVSNSFSIYGIVDYLLIGFVITSILSLLVYAVMRFAKFVFDRFMKIGKTSVN
ncbi:MAG: hypothetical protein JRN67_11140 [Nitrososphaerota archaeon]|nr:hypothetical protein [Nitrososphaerota archaeon]